MEKLTIKDFKAFKGEFDFDFSTSTLLYGENGSGKSSIFEAMRWLFFYEKLENQAGENSATQAEETAQIDQFRNSFDNMATATHFDIKLNGAGYRSINRGQYQVSMFSWNQYVVDNSIDLKELLTNESSEINDVDAFLQTNKEEIKKNVKGWLKNNFFEDFEIEVNPADNIVSFKDDKKGVTAKNELHHVINEAKIHLVVLLLFLASIRYLPDKRGATKLIVMDDVLSSIDEGNKLCFIRLLLENFNDYRIVFFTHNANLFNAFCAAFELKKLSWGHYHLMESIDRHRIEKYPYDSETEINNIQSEINAGHFDAAGNKLRSVFERQLHILAYLMVVGREEETQNLLERLADDKPIYFTPNKSSHDLLNTIERYANDRSKNKEDIKKLIQPYKYEGMASLKNLIGATAVYRKVILHPASHSTGVMVGASKKELECSLDLVKKIYKYINGIRK